MLIIISVSAFAQSNKWFLSFSTGPVVGGPVSSIKHQMRNQGFDDNEISTFAIWGDGNTSYPKGRGMSFLIRGGKKLTEYKSIYIVAGVASTATVEGFKVKGWSDGFFGLFAGSYGDYISVDVNNYQLTTGYMYSFPKSKTQIGIGPSIYVLNCRTSVNHSGENGHTSVIPGLNFTTRLPIGKAKKMFGMELIFEGNMAPSVRMKSEEPQADFQLKNVRMFSATAGLAFTFKG